MPSTTEEVRTKRVAASGKETMRALVFRGPNHIGIEDAPIPKPGRGEAVIRVTLTTICGTDLDILKGEYPVKSGLIIGHEPVGVIHELGVGVTGRDSNHSICSHVARTRMRAGGARCTKTNVMRWKF